MDRKTYRYAVQIQRGDTGEIIEVPSENHWNPGLDFISTSSIAAGVAAEQFIKHNKQIPFAGISAVLQD